jgi:hypothetical protein
MRTGGHVPLRVVNVMCIDLDQLAFFLHFASQLCIASKLVCSLLEAMAGSLSATITAVSSAKVADIVSGEIDRSVVNRRYSNGSRALPWGTPALTGESSVYSFSNLMGKYLFCR